MPTYQYSCTECGHFFEQVQSFSEDSLTVCPQCEGRLRKVFNAVGVVFKGSGFYRTDSRSSATSGDGASSDASSSSSKPTESTGSSTGPGGSGSASSGSSGSGSTRGGSTGGGSTGSGSAGGSSTAATSKAGSAA